MLSLIQLQGLALPNLVQFFLVFLSGFVDFLTCFGVIGPATIARILRSHKVLAERKATI